MGLFSIVLSKQISLDYIHGWLKSLKIDYSNLTTFMPFLLFTFNVNTSSDSSIIFTKIIHYPAIMVGDEEISIMSICFDMQPVYFNYYSHYSPIYSISPIMMSSPLIERLDHIQLFPDYPKRSAYFGTKV
jgi:hypothetical protein